MSRAAPDRPECRNQDGWGVGVLPGVAAARRAQAAATAQHAVGPRLHMVLAEGVGRPVLAPARPGAVGLRAGLRRRSIDELAPDLIHAHDFRMLGVGARAAIAPARQAAAGKLVWDAHEFLPGIIRWRDNARWLPAHVAYEREYAPYADAVITVSDDAGRPAAGGPRPGRAARGRAQRAAG